MKNLTTVKDAWDYCQAVVAGDILACKYLIKACKKLLNEYTVRQHEDDYPWFFHEPSATHYLTFAAHCKYPDGLVAGQHIHLHPWQNFVFTMAYGWRSKTDRSIPRFNDIYTRIARKNDKTTGLSTVACYELLTGPAGHEQYITAVDRTQASIALRKAINIAETLPPFMRNLKSVNATLKHKNNNAFLVARSRDNKASDGAAAYRAYFDEAAMIEDEHSYDVLLSSQGAWQFRHQNWYISTAQANRETRYFMDMESGRAMLDGSVHFPDHLDRKLFIFYELDEEEEWDNPEMWIKSNPSLGLSVTDEFLQQGLHDAKVSPAKRSEFLRKFCNIYTAAENPWLSVDDWNACSVDNIERIGHCYVGLDMGKTSDLNGVSLLWVNPNGYYEADFIAFLPKESYNKASKQVVNVYARALASKKLVLTDGDVIDHRVIKEYIHDICSTYDVKEVVFDPYKSQQMTTELTEEGLNMVQLRQGRVSIGPGTAETERIIMSKLIKHTGDPFISWQIGNAQVDIDQNDLPKISKPIDYSRKIDNVVALIMAIDRATVHGGLDIATPSLYIFPNHGG